MKRLFLILGLLLCAFAARVQAQSVAYVRAGASGTGNGLDWTNAFTGFGTGAGQANPTSLVRGATYYVATGSYSGVTFSAADSGTTLIKIIGATAASHGTATGWSNSFSVSSADGGSQALWTSEVDFTSDYWVWDGTVGPVWDNTPGDYGFSFGTGLNRGTTIGTTGTSSTCGSKNHDITMAHFYGKATSSDVEKEFEEGNTYGGALYNITWSNFLIDGWQGLFMTKSGSCSSDSSADTGFIVQYGVLLNGSSTSANHGEWINPNERPLSGVIIRYNVFRGNSGNAGETGVIVANNSDNTNAVIYGNVFDNNLAGNGIITGTSAGNLNNAVIYNNTFLNMPGASGAALCGSGQGTGNVANNNLFYGMDASVGGGCTTDYDGYFSTTNTPSETHGQTGSGNPFVNSASFNYQLTTDTTAALAITNWSTLPAGCTVGVNCLNIDAAGVARGVNGTIDRGALQIPGSGGSASPGTSMKDGLGVF
jgi:hypothetical protein